MLKESWLPFFYLKKRKKLTELGITPLDIHYKRITGDLELKRSVTGIYMNVYYNGSFLGPTEVVTQIVLLSCAIRGETEDTIDMLSKQFE